MANEKVTMKDVSEKMDGLQKCLQGGEGKLNTQLEDAGWTLYNALGAEIRKREERKILENLSDNDINFGDIATVVTETQSLVNWTLELDTTGINKPASEGLMVDMANAVRGGAEEFVDGMKRMFFPPAAEVSQKESPKEAVAVIEDYKSLEKAINARVQDYLEKTMQFSLGEKVVMALFGVVGAVLSGVLNPLASVVGFYLGVSAGKALVERMDPVKEATRTFADTLKSVKLSNTSFFTQPEQSQTKGQPTPANENRSDLNKRN